jgi:hypothetical protein
MAFSPDQPLILNRHDADLVLAAYPEMEPLILVAAPVRNDPLLPRGPGRNESASPGG